MRGQNDNVNHRAGRCRNGERHAPVGLLSRERWLWRFITSLGIACFINVLNAGCQSGESRPDQTTTAASTVAAGTQSFDVFKGDDIQAVLDHAAEAGPGSVVRVHEGTYAPQQAGQTFLRFNARHDGLTLEAIGEVALTAANAEVADPGAESYPAIVNHVVYFGDGVSRRTTIKGFTITGANSFITQAEASTPLEPAGRDPLLKPGLFFYADGGAIKVFGRSFPTIQNNRIVGNSTRLCGGGISIEHRGLQHGHVMIQDCVFFNNCCPGTGAAIDVLERSGATIENCLFVDNIANTGMDRIADEFGLRYNDQHGCGALTVFPGSHVEVRRCTFTRNWNAVDDRGKGSLYEDCIFWHNTASDGSRPGGPYEIDILDATGVSGCLLGGETPDLRGSLDASRNTLDAPDPDFDTMFLPGSAAYADVGYRSVIDSHTSDTP
ncbi:MAG: right-handed parallel beta-helix repeat-containing protein [Fuerstiella sp.]|nr:right-handed parallel beta-helix repeat-containing protein [Fuerstiella sp.]